MAFQIQIVKGDLLNAQVDMIVQQCNCITVTAHGLSQTIKDRMKIDPYGHRQCLTGRRNCAIKKDRATVGQVTIYQRKNKIPMYVACLFAQFCPSRPGRFYQEILDEHIDPVTSEPVCDTYAQRFVWFERCLTELARRAIKLKCQSIGVPFQIGCGLAGGNWTQYLTALTRWAENHQSQFKVVLYQLT